MQVKDWCSAACATRFLLEGVNRWAPGNGLKTLAAQLLADSTTPDAQYDGVALSFSPETSSD